MLKSETSNVAVPDVTNANFDSLSKEYVESYQTSILSRLIKEL